MKDIMLGSFLLVTPFLLPLFFGISIWLLLRGWYAPALYSGQLWYPNIIDVGVLFLSIYICHLLMLCFEG